MNVPETVISHAQKSALLEAARGEASRGQQSVARSRSGAGLPEAGASGEPALRVHRCPRSSAWQEVRTGQAIPSGPVTTSEGHIHSEPQGTMPQTTARTLPG